MKTNKSEVLKVLEKAKPGLSTNEIIQGADSFLFTGKEILTFNDQVCNRVHFKTEFKGSVKAEPFFKILQKMKPDKDGNIRISLKDDTLVLQSKKAKAGIGIILDGTLPIEELGEFPKDKDFKSVPSNFITGLSMSSFCASTDAVEPILNCVCVKSDFIKSTDSYRAFAFTLNKKMKSFLIPIQNIPVLNKYNITKYCLSDAWIHFKTKEQYNISIRTYPVHEFPLNKIDNVFVTEGSSYKFPASLPEILDKAIIFSDGAFDIDKVVNVKIKGKKLTVSSQSEIGWFNESTIIKNTSRNDLEFETNPNFLKQILDKYDSCVIDKKACKILFRGEGWKYVFAIKVI